MNLDSIPLADLLRLHADVLGELRRREVVRSANGLAGDYAELIVARALGLSLAPRSARGYDATDVAGRRFQIKSRRFTRENGSRQLSAIRGLDLEPFDFLVGVLFEADFTILRACLMPRNVVSEVATYRPWVNAWIMHLRDDLWSHSSVEDVTNKVRAAAGLINSNEGRKRAARSRT